MSEGAENGLAVLTTHPESLTPAVILGALQDIGCGQARYQEIGGHTAPFSLKAL
jgi:hypothetical protein